jgi:D-glucosaminate-6-phosphate ammonia-lyase
MNIYERRGIPTVINAAGTLTRLSGGVMRTEVVTAMAEAAASSVEMDALQAHASSVIAGITGAEAGHVASGAAACLLLGTAACLTGLDPARMARLPQTSGTRNEVIVSRGQRNGYDHAVRAAGAILVDAGLPDRAAGAGVRETEASDIAAAINEQTVAIFWVADAHARPSLPEVVAVAHRAGLPVIVDAAAQLPPQANLRRFVAEGADLVAFSGGKAIGGPQASGFLCGRRDLVMSAALQHLDMDEAPELWDPPAALIDKSRLDGMPRQGIGRTCKAGKEEILGLLTALELFVAEGDAARHARWLADARQVFDTIDGTTGVEAALCGADHVEDIPVVELRFGRGREHDALDLVRALRDGRPAIHLDAGFVDRGVVTINPICLRPGDAEAIATAIVHHLGHART